MKKSALFAIMVVFALVLTACTTSSGLLLKEATVKQLDLKSFESSSVVSIDIDTALMKNVLELQMDTKQVDMLNSQVDFHVGADLLTLAGLAVQPNEDGNVIISLISKDGESIISTSQDKIGLQLSDNTEMLEEALGEGKGEEFNEFVLSLQDIFRDLMKKYIEDYGFSLKQIQSNGTVTINLPTGQSVETEHVELEMTVLEAIEMLQYSLSYFLENEELQAYFYDSISDLPEMVSSFVPVEEEINPAEMQAGFDAMKAELNSGIKDFIVELEGFKSNYLQKYEAELNEFVKINLGMYIGKEDKETYQTEFSLQLNYTDAIANLDIEELKGLPFVPGDSITISSKDLYWNHNKQLSSIEVPNQLVTTKDIMAMEDVQLELKEIAGDNSLIAQFAQFLVPMAMMELEVEQEVQVEEYELQP